MAYQVILNRPGIGRILLEPRIEGVYVNAFSPDGGCFADWLQSDLDMAMRHCEQDYGVMRDTWVVVPNEPIHLDNTEDQEPQFSFEIDENGMPIINTEPR